ncbi:MAG TPA: hypothetical protein VFI12_03105 [Thermomicrobiales bacterium]|jgi:hypothetical protein|nr:hypothetical protein [Thermomicrobiales bacterium]
MRQLIIALILLGSVLALGPAQSATAAPAVTYYVMPTVSVTPTLCSGVECDTFGIRYDYSGEGSCTSCYPTDLLRAGLFSLTFTPNRFFPNDPIRARSGIGTLSVVWADSTTTTAAYSFKARDSKAYSLTGKVTGGTNSRFTAGTAVDGLVGLPPNPVEPGTTAAAISFG